MQPSVVERRATGFRANYVLHWAGFRVYAGNCGGVTESLGNKFFANYALDVLDKTRRRGYSEKY